MYALYARVYTLMYVFIFFFSSLEYFFFLAFLLCIALFKTERKKKRFNRQNEMREIKMKERAYTIEEKKERN